MYKFIAFFTIKLLARLYVRVGVSLTCGKHLHGRIIYLRREFWAHRTSLTPPLVLRLCVRGIVIAYFGDVDI